MHPRNRYNDKPDFGALAEFHPPLKPFLIAKSKTNKPTPTQEGNPPGVSPPKKKFPFTLDFSQPDALRELTYAVLARDFRLDVYFPLDKLIPAVPQRLNYIHWLEDLLGLCDGVESGCVGGEAGCVGSDGVEAGCAGGDGVKATGYASGDSVGTALTTSGHVIGIDIGTGASCIYSLLGTRLNGWKFLATDIDKESIAVARENVSRNGLEDKIQVQEVSPDTVLEGVLDPAVSQYNFCMCNPPFFKDGEERLGGVASRSGRRPPAETFSGASARESITEGGEVEFVMRIINDSLTLKNRVRWYTSMLGKKASLKPLLGKLRQHDVPVVTTTEFVQGRTWRWGIGWSFDSTLKDKVEAHNAGHRKRKERPFCVRLSLQNVFDEEQSARDWLSTQLKELEIDVTEEDFNPEARLVCRADKNTWSHQRKRRRLRERLEKLRTELRETEGEESHQGDGCQVDSPSRMTSHSAKLDLEASEHKIMAELVALSTPCSVQFSCSLGRTGQEESSPKKRKLDSKAKAPPEGEEDGLFVQFEWIEGKDKDSLHQIVQYLQNKQHS